MGVDSLTTTPSCSVNLLVVSGRLPPQQILGIVAMITGVPSAREVPRPVPDK